MYDFRAFFSRKKYMFSFQKLLFRNNRNP